jgi:hypothetical protein
MALNHAKVVSVGSLYRNRIVQVIRGPWWVTCEAALRHPAAVHSKTEVVLQRGTIAIVDNPLSEGT